MYERLDVSLVEAVDCTYGRLKTFLDPVRE